MRGEIRFRMSMKIIKLFTPFPKKMNREMINWLPRRPTQGLNHCKLQVVWAEWGLCYAVTALIITLHSLHCINYIAVITLHSLHCIHYIAFIKLHSLHCLHCITFIKLHSLHWIHCVVFITLHLFHFIHYIAFIMLHS